MTTPKEIALNCFVESPLAHPSVMFRRELIRQYRFMQRIFSSARAALDRTQDPVEQREILLSLGDAALTEHAEWTLMQRERQVEHGKL